MSFWDFLPNILPTVISAGATIYGANQAQKATNQASQQLTQANQDSTQAQLEALKIAEKNLEINRRAASPGLLSLQKIIGRGSQLTPEQKLAVEDSREQSLNALKGSSLRGSARATSAIVSDVDNRVRGGFMEQNRNAADNAARSLAPQYFGANTSIAQNAVNQGNAVSQGLANTGIIQAENTLGQESLRGKAIGDVGALIAGAIKDNYNKDRDVTYQAGQF